VLHLIVIVIPAALSLPPLRGAAVGGTPTILQNDGFTPESLFFPAARSRCRYCDQIFSLVCATSGVDRRY